MKFLVGLLAVVIVSLMFAPSVFAGFEEGASAYKQRDYETALREIRPLAESGLSVVI